MLIFVLQTIWLYIKELAGKDLDITVIIKFLVYFMPKLIPLVVPLTILLASIMVFGSFAENYEFAAMKSTGISLQRAMAGLSVFIILLGFTTFLFSNNVIPWAEYNSLNLRKNIAKLKPAMLLAEGQFNNVGPYNIKFAKKSGDNGQYLEDVIIHIKGTDGRRNATTIKSLTGELVGKETSNVLKLILFDANYYNDILPKKVIDRNKYPFAKSTLEKYTINIDLTKFNDNVDIDEKTQDNRYNMLNIGDLNYTIDSLKQLRKKDHQDLSKILYQRTMFATIGSPDVEIGKKQDSIKTDDILSLFETTSKAQLIDIALNNINSTKQILTSKENSLKISKSEFNKHVISFHEKFALGFACIILFFVGAPLGALIRKGGIGLPMIIAILLFLTYHFIGIFATNSAKSGNLNPVLASWFSTLIMLPLGIYLTKRATADRGLFGFGNILEPIRSMFKSKNQSGVDYKFLSSQKNEELINIIANYAQLGYESDMRYEAINELHKRGLSTNEIREKKEIVIDEKFDVSECIVKDYKDYSKYALTLYTIGVVLFVLFFVFKNNNLSSLQSASVQLSFVSAALFVIYYVISLLNLSKFYSHIRKKDNYPNVIVLIIGLPLYMFIHFYFKFKVKEDLKQNCLDNLK